MDKAVANYIEAIGVLSRKKDILELAEFISSTSGEKAAMWGKSIISFGLYHYRYESGREGDAPNIGLSNRARAIVIYGLHISDEQHPNSQLVEKLGRVTTGKGCLYIAQLSDINIDILEQMIRNAINSSRKTV